MATTSVARAAPRPSQVMRRAISRTIVGALPILPVVPTCPFIRGWMRKHPETHACLDKSFNWAEYDDAKA